MEVHEGCQHQSDGSQLEGRRQDRCNVSKLFPIVEEGSTKSSLTAFKRMRIVDLSIISPSGRPSPNELDRARTREVLDRRLLRRRVEVLIALRMMLRHRLIGIESDRFRAGKGVGVEVVVWLGASARRARGFGWELAGKMERQTNRRAISSGLTRR